MSTFDLNPQNQTPEHLSSTLSKTECNLQTPRAPTELDIYSLENARRALLCWLVKVVVVVVVLEEEEEEEEEEEAHPRIRPQRGELRQRQSQVRRKRQSMRK